MNIITEDDCTGPVTDHPWANKFLVLGYRGGGISFLPHGFFSNWLGDEPTAGSCSIGRCSGVGVGSLAKYDPTPQKLVIGRYVAGGLRLRFLLNGQHESRTISMCMFGAFGTGISHVPPPQYGDTVVGNDVWIGDEVMVLGGSTLADGCVIGARSLVPPNFVGEPYGVYVGAPARLKRFRFGERVRELLLELAWWEMPLSWVREHNQFFLADLTRDEGMAAEMLRELIARKRAFPEKADPVGARP